MLTVLGIEKLKPKEKSYKVSDGNSLYVLVEPEGRKFWRVRYNFGGKEKMLSLGSFPVVSLANARAKRDEVQKLIANGINPSDQKKQEKLIAEVAGKNTFGAVAEEYLQRLKADGVTEVTLSKNRWLLVDLAAPLAKRPIAKITPLEKSWCSCRSMKRRAGERRRSGCAASSVQYSGWRSRRCGRRQTRPMHFAAHLQHRW